MKRMIRFWWHYWTDREFRCWVHYHDKQKFINDMRNMMLEKQAHEAKMLYKVDDSHLKNIKR